MSGLSCTTEQDADTPLRRLTDDTRASVSSAFAPGLPKSVSRPAVKHLAGESASCHESGFPLMLRGLARPDRYRQVPTCSRSASAERRRAPACRARPWAIYGDRHCLPAGARRLRRSCRRRGRGARPRLARPESQTGRVDLGVRRGDDPSNDSVVSTRTLHGHAPDARSFTLER